MISGRGSSALVWIKVIQWCGKKVRVVLNVTGKDLDWSSNSAEKVFDQMGHRILVGGSIKLEFLLEFCQFKEHRFGFIGHRISEVWNGLNYVVDGIFERISWLNWCVGRLRGESEYGDRISNSKSNCWVYTGRV